MRAALVLGLLAVPVGLEAQRKAERRFAIAPDAAVRIVDLTGSVTIEGWDRDSIAATALIQSDGGEFFAGGSGRVAKLGIEASEQGLSTAGGKLMVRVPRAARVWVKTASASVSATGLRGEIEVSSITGPVSVVGEPRVVTIESIDGTVLVRGAATLTRVKTGAGDVQLIGVRGAFSVTTVQGRAAITTDEILSGRIETVSGPVEVNGSAPPGSRLEVTSHEGDANLHLTPPVDARFDLSTVEGRIVTRFFDVDKIYRERAATFWVGPSAGTHRGATVVLRTFKGNIRVDSNPK